MIYLHVYAYLKESWLTGVCNSHDEQSNEDQEVEKEEGGNWVCLDEIRYPTSTDHNRR